MYSEKVATLWYRPTWFDILLMIVVTSIIQTRFHLNDLLGKASCSILNVSHGLRHLFAIASASIEELQRETLLHYSTLGKGLGVKVPLRVTPLRQMGYKPLLSTGDASLASQ